MKITVAASVPPLVKSTAISVWFDGLMSSESTSVPLARRSVALTSGWSVRATAGPVPSAITDTTIPATVPGSVHTDLLAAGLIDDPYLNQNEKLQGWIGLTDWTYATEFDWQPAGEDRVELDFAGLDTIASVSVNGSVVGEARNMHRRYRFDITDVVREGANAVVVDFLSPIKFADAASLSLGYRPHVNQHPYNAIRKMACSFGWDWGLDTSTSGIWRPVTLESWSSARITGIRPVATIDGADGVVSVHVELNRTGEGAVVIEASVAGETGRAQVDAGATSAVLQLRVADVKKWWPRGHGDQPLYDVDVRVLSGETVIDSGATRVGFRSVELRTTPDADGTPFVIVVNGKDIMIKGTNWIPDDAFPHRVDRARYAHRIEQAEFANVNLLRVWGGGIYESDDFYDLCDEQGMLTWQDFLLACAAYAEEDPMWSEFEQEARENVARLASHPSLVVFNGNNENIWGYEEWNWSARLEGQTWGEGYYYDLFPSIVAEFAPHIGYTPGSPFSPDRTMHPNDPANGTVHIWDLWNQRDYPHYRDYTPRFVSEFGWQGPPTWSALTESIDDSPLTPESPGMLVHQKAAEGNAKLTDGLVAHLPLPNDMEDWHWAMSLNQAVAVRTALEHFRSLEPHCAGAIVWQLNDCWPVTSWAAVDGYGREKPLLYAIQRAFAPRFVTIQPRGESLVTVVSNDTDEPWQGELEIRRSTFRGDEVASTRIDVSLQPRSASTIEISTELGLPDATESEYLRASVGGESAFWFFAEYRDSDLGDAQLTSSLEVDGRIHRLSVTAGSLVRDLTLLVDKLDPSARANTALVTLESGESVTFEFESARTLILNDLTESRVLRSANQLVSH
jgi:beta-mannosidase